MCILTFCNSFEAWKFPFETLWPALSSISGAVGWVFSGHQIDKWMLVSFLLGMLVKGTACSVLQDFHEHVLSIFVDVAALCLEKLCVMIKLDIH